MEDVLDVYARPYDPRRPQVCLDELSCQLLGEVAEPLPPVPRPAPGQPGRPRRRDYEYTREGTANLFVAVEPQAGRRVVRVTERRTAQDFARFLRDLLDGPYAAAEQVVLVTDNLNTHSPAALYATFDPATAWRLTRRIEWHYTPKHGSWLNMAEIEIGILKRQCLRRRLPDPATMATEVAAWELERNWQRATITWTFTTKDARTKLARLYEF
jgi:transposase